MVTSCWSYFLNLLQIVLVLQYKYSQKLFQLATISSSELVQFKHSQRLPVAVGCPVRHGPGQCSGGGGGAGGWVPWDVGLAEHQ